jgi:hypothetical protein
MDGCPEFLLVPQYTVSKMTNLWHLLMIQGVGWKFHIWVHSHFGTEPGSGYHDKTKHTQEVCILKNNAIKKRRSQILDY